MPPAAVLTSIPLASGGIVGADSRAPARFEFPERGSLQLSNGTCSGSSSHHSLGMSLSPTTTPFTQRLVDRVQSGQFVEMRDLLTDNMSLLQQIDVLGGQHAVPSLPEMLKPLLREVSTLPIWVYYFLAYVAMQTEDGQVRDMLAYARHNKRVTEACWLDYDRVFRQQAALDASMRWITLDPSIQASTLVGHAPSHTMVCGLCREPDHVASQCALLPTCSL